MQKTLYTSERSGLFSFKNHQFLYITKSYFVGRVDRMRNPTRVDFVGFRYRSTRPTNIFNILTFVEYFSRIIEN